MAVKDHTPTPTTRHKLSDFFRNQESTSILKKTDAPSTPFERVMTREEIMAIFDKNPEIRERVKEVTGFDVFDAPADCFQYWHSNTDEFADFFLVARPTKQETHPMVAVRLKMIDGKLAEKIEDEHVVFSEHLVVGMNWYTQQYPGGFWSWLQTAVVEAKGRAAELERLQATHRAQMAALDAQRKKRVAHLRAYRSRFHFEIGKLVSQIRSQPKSGITVLQTPNSTVVTGISYSMLVGLLGAIRRDVTYHAMGDRKAVDELQSVIRAVMDMWKYLTDGETQIELAWDFSLGILDLNIVNIVEEREEIYKRSVDFAEFPMKVDAELFD
jgi:hypothetical protein